MPDRTINFGDSETDARYRIQDTSSTGGDFVIAEDLDGGTVLLEYDYSAGEFVSRGPVNLNGNDITDAGSVSADTLEADQVSTNELAAVAYPTSEQTVTSLTATKLNIDATEIEDDNVVSVDISNNELKVQKSGVYVMFVFVTWKQDSGWSTGDSCVAEIYINGSKEIDGRQLKTSTPQQSVIVHFIKSLTSGDSLYTNVFQNSGSDKFIESGKINTRLQVVRLG